MEVNAQISSDYHTFAKAAVEEIARRHIKKETAPLDKN